MVLGLHVSPLGVKITIETFDKGHYFILLVLVTHLSEYESGGTKNYSLSTHPPVIHSSNIFHWTSQFTLRMWPIRFEFK